jgi:hypothetical protein
VTTREKKSKGGLEWLGTSSRALGLHRPSNAKNWRERRPGILCIPGPILRRPSIVAHGAGKEDSPNLSAEDGTQNTASWLYGAKEWRMLKQSRELKRRT